MKTCSKCGVAKPLDEFHRQADGKDGHRPDCKACFQAAKKARLAGKPAPKRPAAKPAPERPVKLPAVSAFEPCPGCGRLVRDRLWCSSSCRREARAEALA